MGKEKCGSQVSRGKLGVGLEFGCTRFCRTIHFTGEIASLWGAIPRRGQGIFRTIMGFVGWLDEKPQPLGVGELGFACQQGWSTRSNLEQDWTSSNHCIHYGPNGSFDSWAAAYLPYSTGTRTQPSKGQGRHNAIRVAAH